MKDLLRTQLISRSDKDQFCFSITCMECGRTWTSTPQMKTGSLLNKEMALEQAAEEAMQALHACPICGHIVCQSCFVTCGDLYLCHACAAALLRYEETAKSRTSYQERKTL